MVIYSITVINNFNGDVLIIILAHMHLDLFVDIISRSHDKIWTPSIASFSQLLASQKKRSTS